MNMRARVYGYGYIQEVLPRIQFNSKSSLQKEMLFDKFFNSRFQNSVIQCVFVSSSLVQFDLDISGCQLLNSLRNALH